MQSKKKAFKMLNKNANKTLASLPKLVSAVLKIIRTIK